MTVTAERHRAFPSTIPDILAAPRQGRARGWWPAAFIAAATAIVLLHLLGLSHTPPGLAGDEAAIGYNAWAIGHHGVDEHGTPWPLYLQSFGDWKSPLYVYLLAPLTRVLPLTAATIRLPAVFCGLVICALATLTAWRLARSRGVALVLLLTAGLTPWLMLQSRLGLEVITLVLCLVAALWCLAHAELGDHAVWYLGAGVALGLGVFAYPTGRLVVALLAVALVAVHRARGRGTRWWLALFPIGVAYAALGAYMLAHPGALTARFGALSIAAGGTGVPVIALRFVGNYLAHFNPWFLLLRGDSNIRHSTGFGGMLMLASLPFAAAGVVACARRWNEPLARFAILGLLIAPIPAALTEEGIPHSLRAAPMVPFLLFLSVYGAQRLLPWFSRHRRALLTVMGIAGVQVSLYTADLFATYPSRAAGAFDSGIDSAIARAHQVAAGGPVLLSTSLGDPYVHALVLFTPDPRHGPWNALADLGIREVTPGQIDHEAHGGDLLVLSPRDRPPSGSALLWQERIPDAVPGRGTHVAVDVYRD